MHLSEATILLVDDEPDLREILAQWLTLAGGHKVKTAANGQAALTILKETPIDLLVTDIRMPEMDGITLVRRLFEVGGEVPGIVFISGFGDIDEREMCGLGVEVFLSKPLSREEMIGAMERALAERSALWLTPMKIAPRQSLHLQNACIGRPEAADAGEAGMQSSVHFGRGGISLISPTPVSLGKVTFRCSFPSEDREIAGEGFVRWRSRADGKVGIEFAWLEPVCRPWVLQEIEATHPRSFIPSFLT